MSVSSPADPAAFWSTFTWGRGLIFISHPSLHKAGSSVIKENQHKERKRSEIGTVGAPVCCFDTECGSNSWRPDTLPAMSTESPSACQKELIYSVAFKSGCVHLCERECVGVCRCVCVPSTRTCFCLHLLIIVTIRDFNQSAAHLHTSAPLFFLSASSTALMSLMAFFYSISNTG